MNPQITQMDTDSKNKKDQQTHAIIGAAMEVHGQMGSGFLESVYQEALAVEFTARGIPFAREIELTVRYKGQPLRCTYKADFICFGLVLVELKALTALGGVEQAQVINYLKATGLERGLLINFGRSSLEFRRVVFSNLRKSAQSADHLGANGDVEQSTDCAD